MAFRLDFQPEARKAIDSLKNYDPKKYKKVFKTLGLLEKDPRYPGLHTHKYDEFEGPGGETVLQSYVENNTPGAFRVFWYYGPEKDTITIFAITPHP